MRCQQGQRLESQHRSSIAYQVAQWPRVPTAVSPHIYHGIPQVNDRTAGPLQHQLVIRTGPEGFVDPPHETRMPFEVTTPSGEQRIDLIHPPDN